MNDALDEIIFNLLNIKDHIKIELDDDLTNFGLDSLNCIELIITIEDKFNIKISEENFSFTSFRTKQKILDLMKDII